MEWLQKFYILILNPFCNLSGKISPGVKKTCIYIICFLLYGTCYCWYSIIGMGTQLTLLSRMLESIFLIIVLIFLGLEKPLKPVKWNGLFIYCWFALGMLILIMGFFNEQNTGYWMTGKPLWKWHPPRDFLSSPAPSAIPAGLRPTAPAK